MRYNKQSCGAGSGSRREEVAPPVHSSDSAAITVTIGVNRNTKITLSLIRVQSNIPYKIPPLLGQPLVHVTGLTNQMRTPAPPPPVQPLIAPLNSMRQTQYKQFDI